MKYANAILAVLFLSGLAKADLIYTSSPEGSWGYSYEANAGHGFSTTYYPTSTAEFGSATFQGYVTYNHVNADGSAYFGAVYNDPGDTFHVFSTYLTSTRSQTIGLTISGDDGHSLFVNDHFVAGGGFGATPTYDLTLIAGVSTKLELAGYNGPGGWVFGITAPESYGDITIDASPTLAAVPEPSALALFGMAAITLLGYYAWLRWRQPRLA